MSAPCNSLELRLPVQASSVAEAQRSAREFLETHGIDKALLTDLELAIGEAARNAVEHGAPCASGNFVVRVSVNGVAKVEVCDCGHFDEESLESGPGLGLELIRRVCDCVSVSATEGRTTIRLEKAL